MAGQGIEPGKLSIGQLQVRAPPYFHGSSPLRPPLTLPARTPAYRIAPQFLAKQLEEENTVLSANFNQLKQAQAKFSEAAACMASLAQETEGARRCALWSARAARAPRHHSRPPTHPRPPPHAHSPNRAPAGKEVLVPLTSSLYVPGVLDPRERVLVDIGTSFYVGKSAGDARALLAKKAALLKENTETLYRVINEKRDNLDTVQRTLEIKQQREGGGAA